MRFETFYKKHWSTIKNSLTPLPYRNLRDVNHAFICHKLLEDHDAFERWVVPYLDEYMKVRERVTSVSVTPKKQTQSVWVQLLADAEDCGTTELVDHYKEMHDFPPSSVCCGAKGKHQKKMIERARLVIERARNIKNA